VLGGMVAPRASSRPLRKEGEIPYNGLRPLAGAPFRHKKKKKKSGQLANQIRLVVPKVHHIFFGGDQGVQGEMKRGKTDSSRSNNLVKNKTKVRVPKSEKKKDVTKSGKWLVSCKSKSSKGFKEKIAIGGSG